MKISFKSFFSGVLIGVCFSFFIPVMASTAMQTTKIEKTISSFIHSLKCRVVAVQDIDLWEGKVLVKANQLNISFVMTALDGATYEICPVGIGIKTLQSLEKKK
tara:strand:+ start:2598 stop:2909 length:312 start_codon:yes stop_codon:yes gene_type:complete